MSRKTLLTIGTSMLCLAAVAGAQLTPAPVHIRVIGALHLGASIDDFKDLEPIRNDAGIQMFRVTKSELSLEFLKLDSLEIGFHQGLLVSGAFTCHEADDGEALANEFARLHGSPVARSDRASVWVTTDIVLAAEHSDSICRAGFTSRSTIEALRSNAGDEQRRRVEETLK